MSLLNITIEKVIVQVDDKKLDLIIKKLNIMAGELTALQQTVTDLKVSIDTKQAAIEAAITAFNQTIADLTAQLANGATPAQLQAVIDDLNIAKADLESTPTT
jgi:prefoldin subunit 5